MTRFGEEVNYIDDHDAYLAVLMVENARKVLAAGFTTVRDTGSPRDMTIDIARAARDGLFVAPRIQYAANVDISYRSKMVAKYSCSDCEDASVITLV